jgi:tungstate transport system permease protein
MGFLLQSLWGAIGLIVGLDRDLFMAIGTTLRVSITSTAIAAVISLPLAFLIARFDFRGKPAVLTLLRTALALPTVVIGLFVYAFVARNAPLGELQLLFTRTAIIIGQVILIVPLITALVHSVLQRKIMVVYEEARLLGASPLAASWKTFQELRLGVATALMAGFGRVVSEVGISLILGGNIRGLTRTITTAITLETSQGHFAQAFALGVVLLAIVLIINTALRVREDARDA